MIHISYPHTKKNTLWTYCSDYILELDFIIYLMHIYLTYGVDYKDYKGFIYNLYLPHWSHIIVSNTMFRVSIFNSWVEIMFLCSSIQINMFDNQNCQLQTSYLLHSSDFINMEKILKSIASNRQDMPYLFLCTLIQRICYCCAFQSRSASSCASSLINTVHGSVNLLWLF